MFRAVRPVLDEIVPLASRSTNVFQKPKDDGRVDCVGMVDGLLTIIDFKSSSRPKEEHMRESWYIQMTAYAIMVEELTGHPIEQCMALVDMYRR